MIKGIRIFRSIILSALVVTVFAIANHWIKSEVITKEERLDSLKARIQTEENRIMVLEADWAYLTRPSRIEQLSRDLLSFAPIEPARILSLDSISNADFTPESSKATGLFRISDGGAE
ncbi:MAG: cell division protein FtsL [Candidatus Puniceispirillales bacterium]